ncbi:MAG: glycosyltransferase [Deltaproteobacteria bacterium]|nr:glycosyltransferase [Deltaproteobacteria bacterium]
MASILSVTSGFPSILYPSVELARRLAVVGHQVTFAGLPACRELVERQGLAFLPLEASRYEAFLEGDAKESYWHRLSKRGERVDRAVDSLATEGFSRDVRQLNPDLILIDGEMHEHIITASTVGIPLVLLNSFASIWRRPGLPPPHCQVQPDVGFWGSRGGIWLLWRALRLRKWRKAVSQWGRWVGCDRLSVLRRLAAEQGFDWHREIDASQWLIPFTYRRFPVLSLHALEFDFPHQPPKRVHYVGPLLLESRPDRQLPPEDRARLEAIFQRRRRGAKLIYAGFGSMFSADLAFLKRLLGVVAGRPEWDLVVSLSDRVAPADLGPLPERVHVFPWVPQLEVVRQADVVVTHGGINTLDECVVGGSRGGVPVLIYCGSETDMAGNTARVLHHGIGIAGDREGDTTETIQGHIDRLLTAPSFRASLARLRRSYQRYVENQVAEGAVKSLLGSLSTPLAPPPSLPRTEEGRSVPQSFEDLERPPS